MGSHIHWPEGVAVGLVTYRTIGAGAEADTGGGCTFFPVNSLKRSLIDLFHVTATSRLSTRITNKVRIAVSVE